MNLSYFMPLHFPTTREEENNEKTAALRSRWIDRSIQSNGSEWPSLSARGALPRLSGGKERMA